jgi:hypothetical protein
MLHAVAKKCRSQQLMQADLIGCQRQRLLAPLSFLPPLPLWQLRLCCH